MGDGSERLDTGDQSYFLKSWRTYRKFLDLNYMFHREVYDLLHRVLLTEATRPFRFLDIACGDAAATVTALRGTEVAAYVGIDLSPQALEIARVELAALTCPVTLLEGDFRAALADMREPVDVAWIGQSLHHMPRPEDKLAVMREARRLLAPRGLFLIWEPTTPAGRDRAGWLARFETIGRANSPGLDADEWATVFEHSRVSDFPETAERWLSLGREAGFASAREMLDAPPGLARVYCFGD